MKSPAGGPDRGIVRFFIPLGVLVGAAVATFLSTGPAAAVSACGRSGYSYAGLAANSPARGVRAFVVPLGNPYVESGHVAAWVGVGGPGLGTGGTDAWIQVGLASFRGTDDSRLYFETNRPGIGPRYTQVRAAVAPGARHRMAVAEMVHRPGWWRVWVDGSPVSEPVFLPGSHGRWRPIATAETWDGGQRVCNLFSYRFDRLAVAGARGGVWYRFRTGGRFQDPGYRVLSGTRGFVARAVRPLPRATAAVTPAPAPTDQNDAAVDAPATDTTAPAADTATQPDDVGQ